jgi:type VI secretion system (T6SS) effector Tae4 (amidase)
MGLPAIDMLWLKYADGTKDNVADLVGGAIAGHIRKDGWDTCCIRVSRSLNYSGVPVTGFGSIANPGLGSGAKVRAMQGADHKWYIYSTYDFREYLTSRFGHPKRFRGDAAESAVTIPGVIMYGYLHVDLWDGSSSRHLKFFGDKRIAHEGIYVWPAAGGATAT